VVFSSTRILCLLTLVEQCSFHRLESYAYSLRWSSVLFIDWNLMLTQVELCFLRCFFTQLEMCSFHRLEFYRTVLLNSGGAVFFSSTSILSCLLTQLEQCSFHRLEF
jgi:hypothetical protein